VIEEEREALDLCIGSSFSLVFEADKWSCEGMD